ncbi:hypothetical protein [Mycolicibacterium sp. F2034L]|uniref:hypothetical protein n=1 Tax=Mycolicibacterium sp. F2034L TaxID=2926422 RepID=UPI001FF4AC90|nr:hypothetical protein [Mycolicibacterium sp. F2034L]MCK0176121.1 hypothetical protein [Mycolicibacterium sp. F2034L]
MTPARLRLRRRLLLWTAPLILLLLVAVAKLVSVGLAGNAAVGHFADGDAEALRSDGAVLGVVNVVEPAKAPFVQGLAAVLGDRLDDADVLFADALSRTPADRSCPVRVNLQLVRERRGDHAGFDRRTGEARAHYESALVVIAEAPAGCFAGNTDPDPERRAVLAEAEARLRAKLATVDDLPLPPPPPPQAASPPPPPVVLAPGETADDTAPDVELRLDPQGADPLERLQQILRDSAG